jgi:hypothetical protein
VSDPGRRKTPDATPRSPIGEHPLDTPPKCRLQICWLGLARSFASEFFPERLHAPLDQSVRLPTPLARTVSLA